MDLKNLLFILAILIGIAIPTIIVMYLILYPSRINNHSNNRVNEALQRIPNLKPEIRYCNECGKLMTGTFIDAEFFQYHGKLGVPIYYMTVSYTCPNGHSTQYRQGVNNYEGY